MATSQNGYLANDRSLIGSYTVPGVAGSRWYFRKGDTAVVLVEFVRRWNLEVEKLDGGVLDDWSYAERPIRGSTTTLSNHASGTAVDLNASRHPLGKTGTFSATQVRAIRKLLADFRGTVRWGGDYSGRKDEMHAELDRDWPEIIAMADVIRAGTPKPPPAPVDPAATVVGAIGDAYRKLGGVQSPLGLPRSQEVTCPDGYGRRVDFAGGSIWWTPGTGAHEVHGDILAVAYAGLQWEAGVLGYPTSDEMACTLGPGRWQSFERGAAWWTPATGAHAVYGAIRQAWAAQGYETGHLGYPTGDEHDVPTGRAQSFERGLLTFDASTGTVTAS